VAFLVNPFRSKNVRSIGIEEVHKQVPQVRLEPMTSYEDEDFTLAVIVPAGEDEEAVLDHCLAASAAIEDKMEVYILP
jgi:hypothetical protein